MKLRVQLVQEAAGPIVMIEQQAAETDEPLAGKIFVEIKEVYPLIEELRNTYTTHLQEEQKKEIAAQRKAIWQEQSALRPQQMVERGTRYRPQESQV